MLQRLKELFRHSAIYGLGSIVARILAVLLLPLYTRYLSPTDYGLIETLVVYAALLTYSRHALGLQFDRKLYRAMNRFGLPLVPSAVALWLTNFSDRFFLVKLTDAHEVGLYSIGVRVASAIVLLLTAFRMAWPAFAYSIEDDREAQRTYSFVLTYVVYVCCWLALALGLLAPWIL